MLRPPTFKQIRNYALISLGHLLIFLLVFVGTLRLVFPYESLRERVVAEAKRGGLDLKIDQLSGAGLLGVEARAIAVHIPEKGPRAAADLALERATLRPALWRSLTAGPSGTLDLHSAGLKGRLSATRSPEQLDLEINDLAVDLGALGPVWDLVSLGFTGKISGSGAFQIPVAAADAGGRAEVEAIAGTIDLSTEEVKLSGGMIAGFPVPGVELGAFALRATGEKGQFTFDEPLQLDSADLRGSVEGSVQLQRSFSSAQAGLNLRFKPTDAFWERNGRVAALAKGFLRAAEGGDGFYGYRLEGPLGRPRFTPKR